jgi:hypothetical protein
MVGGVAEQLGPGAHADPLGGVTWPDTVWLRNLKELIA